MKIVLKQAATHTQLLLFSSLHNSSFPLMHRKQSKHFFFFSPARHPVCHLRLIAFLSGYQRCWLILAGMSLGLWTELRLEHSPTLQDQIMSLDTVRCEAGPPYAFISQFFFFYRWPSLGDNWQRLTAQSEATALWRPWDCKDASASRFSEVRITSFSVIALFSMRHTWINKKLKHFSKEGLRLLVGSNSVFLAS